MKIDEGMRKSAWAQHEHHKHTNSRMHMRTEIEKDECATNQFCETALWCPVAHIKLWVSRSVSEILDCPARSWIVDRYRVAVLCYRSFSAYHCKCMQMCIQYTDSIQVYTVYTYMYIYSVLLNHIPVSKLEEGALLLIHLEWKGLLIEDTFDATIETMHQSITWDANTRLYYGTSGGVTEASSIKNGRLGEAHLMFGWFWMSILLFVVLLDGPHLLPMLKYVSC